MSGTENLENDINNANTVFPFANKPSASHDDCDFSVNDVVVTKPSTAISEPAATPSKIPTFQRGSTPARAVKFDVTTGPTTCTPKKLATNATSHTTPSSSREAAIQAKLQSTAERKKKVAGLKDKWAKEKERKMQSHRQKRAEELKRQQENMSAASEQRRVLAEKRRDAMEKQKEQERKVLQASLEAASQLSKDLAENMKARRRQSTLLKTEILRRQEAKTKEIAAAKKTEEDSLNQSKREDMLAVREAKKQAEMKRRQSMAAKTEVARQIKEVESNIAMEAKEQEKSLLDFRYSAWVGEKEYKKNEEAKRRESMVGRLDAWRTHKSMDNELKQREHHENIEYLDSKRLDWQSRNEMKSQEALDRRQSLALRLQTWRDQNAQIKLSKIEEAEAERYNNELKAQEREDVLNYKQQCNEDRRSSLAHRLATAREDKNWERGQAALLAIAAEESRQLQAEDIANLAAYKQKQEEERRNSLQFRNEVGRQEALRQEELKQKEHDETVQDYEIKHDDWICMQEYQQQLRDERRKSLAMRLVLSRKQKEGALNAHRNMLDAMHEEFELKRATWNDVQTYQATERENRRKSVNLRLDSWRQQKLVCEKLRNQQLLQQEEDAYIKEQEAEDLRNAKEALKNAEKMDLLLGRFAF